MKKLLATAATVLLSTSAAFATPMLSFIIDGNTFQSPFSFTNTSDAGETITRFSIDLSTAATPGGSGGVFDIVNGGVPNSTVGVPFTPSGGSGAVTGLTSNTVVDGGTTLDIFFNDFDVGESFVFDIDVDDATGSPATITGDQLIGATAFADFSDGQRVSGVFGAISGNDDASGFMATGITLTPAIPLPASALLLLGGFGALGAARRLRKS